MAKDKEFKMPESVLSSLNEFSAGGYLLFTFDSEGNPVINNQFDTKAHAVYMQAYIKQWICALEEINHQIIVNSIINYKAPKKKK